MSSSTNSPQRFSGTYDSFYTDAAAAAAASSQHDINNRMRVPKRIRVTGEHDDSPSVNWANYNKAVPETLSMNVPERIMVSGDENHIGARSIPREFEVEDSMLPRPPDPALYRVNTPPRTITLNNYTPNEEDTVTTSPQSSHPPSLSGVPSLYNGTYGTGGGAYDDDTASAHPQQQQQTAVVASHTPSTIGPGEELSPPEELQLLRRQVGRLNRRIMALELDTQQRSNREVILYSVGVAYCILRSVMWFNRN